MSKEKEAATFINEPKAIALKERTFMANGNQYYIAEKISIDRWKEYEKLVPRLTYGVGFNEMQNALLKAYNALNSQKFADASVIIHNIMSGIKDADDEKRVPPGLMMCALIMNKEGENVGVFDEQIMLSKIEDWRAEGLDILSFFAWALTSITGFRETYLLYIQAQAKHMVEKTDILEAP